MNYLVTKAYLNILHLGSYDLLIGMDSLEKHRAVLNCLEKTFTCIYEKGISMLVKGVPKKVYTQKIFAL